MRKQYQTSTSNQILYGNQAGTLTQSTSKSALSKEIGNDTEIKSQTADTRTTYTFADK